MSGAWPPRDRSSLSGGTTALVPGEGLLAPLDGLRALLLGWLARGLGPRRVRPLLSGPELRVAILGCLSVATALLLTHLVPLALLAISPLLLGVPHLVADVRYLVAQPGLHRRLRLAVPVGLALLLAGFGLGMPAGLGAIAATLLLADGGGRSWRASLGRRAAGLGLLFAALLYGRGAGFYPLELGLAHLHNFVAILMFYLWRRRARSLHVLPGLLFAAGALALLMGVLPARPAGLGWFAGSAGLSADGQRAWLAGFLPFEWGMRLVLLFAFAQAVHYSIWLRLIPEEARERPAPRPFRASLRKLREDVGGPLLGLAAAVALTLALWGLIDLAAARLSYFRLALFHGYLELCVLALWWVEGRPAPTATS